MRMKTIITAAFLIGMLMLGGCAASAAPDTAMRQSDIVTITFDFQKQSGYAANQFAVWIEDENGVFIKTLYATRFTAKGGFRERADAIPVWVERSGISNATDADAVTGATPKSGTLQYVWDLTDDTGERVANGTYRFYVEGTLRWKNRVLFSGEIKLDGSATSVDATPEYIYEASADQPALTDESPENEMITLVHAAYIPPN